MHKLLVLTLCFTLALFAFEAPASLSGEWVGTIDIHDADSGAVISTPVRLSLSQDQGVISGKIGRDGENDITPIQHARLEGNKLLFEAVNADVVGPVKFVLAFANDGLQGEMKASVDGGDITGHVKMSREKK